MDIAAKIGPALEMMVQGMVGIFVVLGIIALMVAVSVIISLILRDVYFIDAILAIIPFVYSVRIVLIKNALPLFGVLMLGLSLFSLVSRVLLVAFEPMRPMKGASKKAK